MKHWEKPLKELSSLEDGWYNGEGYSISKDAIENTRKIMGCLQNHYKQNNLPTIFPTPQGGVQLQYSPKEGSLYGEVLIDSQERYEGYLLHHLTGQEQHCNLSDWVEASNFIETWFGAETKTRTRPPAVP